MLEANPEESRSNLAHSGFSAGYLIGLSRDRFQSLTPAKLRALAHKSMVRIPQLRLRFNLIPKLGILSCQVTLDIKIN